VGDPELLDDALRRVEMLQVVAHEHDVEVVVGCRIGQREAVGLDESNVLRHAGGGIAQVGRPALGGADVADEVAGVGSDIEHLAGLGDVSTLEEAADLPPDRLLRAALALSEAQVVDR
jgi:hypothetical protein